MEQVVLLDESGHATGVMDKASVHHRDTPLHLAFSCYVFSQGELLITQRAHSKPTWPGVWTNTCCGHPAPGEALEHAIRRRLRDELGLQVPEMSLALPRFRYRAVMPNGVVENEMCPVYYAFADAAPKPNPDEVADTCWVDWRDFTAEILAGRTTVSPWCEQQVRQLAELGTEPTEWPVMRHDDLPAAAR